MIFDCGNSVLLITANHYEEEKMKMLKALSIAIILMLMAQAASAQAPQWADKLHNVTITALIDGRDLFVLRPKKVYWHHLDYVVVGRYYGNWPTGLLMDRQAPNTQYLSWIPSWPCNDWSCNFEQVDSSTLTLAFPLPSRYQIKGLKVLQAPDGGSATVYQYPSADKHYTTIIDFNDDPLGGPHWYQVLLTFAEGQTPEPVAPAKTSETDKALGGATAATPGLSTIYSNLGTEDDVYDCCTALTSAGSTSPVGVAVEVANGFTPAVDATIGQVQVALGYALGTNAISVSLRSDDNGLPGAVIAQWTPANLPSLGTCCDLVTQDFPTGIPVTGGTQYWLVVRQTSANPDAWNAWNLNTTNASGPFAIKVGHFINQGVRQQGAFGIFGQ